MGQKTYFSLSFPIFLYFSFGALAQSTLGMKGLGARGMLCSLVCHLCMYEQGVLLLLAPCPLPQPLPEALPSESTAFWWRPVVAIVIATAVVVVAATLGVSGLSATFA